MSSVFPGTEPGTHEPDARYEGGADRYPPVIHGSSYSDRIEPRPAYAVASGAPDAGDLDRRRAALDRHLALGEGDDERVEEGEGVAVAHLPGGVEGDPGNLGAVALAAPEHAGRAPAGGGCLGPTAGNPASAMAVSMASTVARPTVPAHDRTVPRWYTSRVAAPSSPVLRSVSPNGSPGPSSLPAVYLRGPPRMERLTPARNVRRYSEAARLQDPDLLGVDIGGSEDQTLWTGSRGR